MSPSGIAIVSSDWNECLAPSGPFDFISFIYPQIESDLSDVFRQYTGNRITLGKAAGIIQNLMPAPVTPEQIDAYLDESFAIYKGVTDLIEWCLSKNIVFMINTTGMLGYFQRIFAKGLLPRIPVISAHPMIRFPEHKSDPPDIYELNETRDKGRNTAAVLRAMGIPARKVILLGDSGGDGPHFEWGAKTGAFLVSSMTKPSLNDYCRNKDITINLRFGLDYSRGQNKDPQKESQINFMDLANTIDEIVKYDRL
jgi:2-hydroxy-3-keto-5-methylthiopentenyl-1-phosphate phosphatase